MCKLKWPGILSLALIAMTADVAAITFSFPFPGSSDRNGGPPPGPPPWQFRPQDPNNARGVPPSYQVPPATRGQMPGQMQIPGYQGAPAYQPVWPGRYSPPYGQPQSRQPSQPPRLELDVIERRPYVQQNVLLKLRVISAQNLETATPDLPNSNDILLQKLKGPTARSRSGEGGRREIINEFVYTLTPLRAGDLELPALSVSGTIAGNGYGYGHSGGRRFEATSKERILLQVRPAMASVRPWLPLKDLSLNATLDGGPEVDEGQPVTLALVQKAVGATGSQLPSLERFLRGGDFRVYREQTITEGGLSSDGRDIEGERTEYFTLVPSSGGKLLLPEIRLPWWDVRNGTREYANLPIHTLQVEGESGPFGLGRSAETAGRGGASWFWLPLIGLVLLLLGYWAGVWYKGRTRPLPAQREILQRLEAGARAAALRAGAGVKAAARRLDPAPVLARVKPALGRALPPSSRFLLCVRAANREGDPAAWAERFQDMTCRHLHFDAKAPLPGVTGQILRLRPGADREQIERLMEQLDGALYGKQDIDFRRWKKQFNRQISRGRGLFRDGARRKHIRRPLLPELNPQSARS